MSYLNSVVDRVYVINLDKDKERLRKIGDELNTAGIAWERFSAVLGKNVKSDPRLTGFCNEFCTDGIKGCALSHRTIWETAVAHKYDSVMILEDDAHVPPDLNEKLRDLLAKIPNDWDLLYLGCRFYCNDEHFAPQVANRLMGTVPEEHDGAIKKVKGSVGAHATIYRTKFLQKILEEPINTHIDLEMHHWVVKYKAKAYGLYPEIIPVGEEHTNSNLSETFPPLFTTAANNIEIADNIPLGWSVSESFMKLGWMNVNALVLILALIGGFAPVWVLYGVVAWLAIELVVSGGDVKAWGRLMLWLGVGYGLRKALVKKGGSKK
jgi:GR25 family glycosyltransferase involved in LPS biosynthesis